jgi:hypothetical protein
MHQIALRVVGVDIHNRSSTDSVAQANPKCAINWHAIDGVILAIVRTVSRDYIEQVASVARSIREVFPESRVRGVDPDLVGITDIANRVDVTREAVRLWAKGERGPGGFPAPVSSISRGDKGASTLIWEWYEVSEWLAEHIGLRDSYEYLTQQEVAYLTLRLHEVNSECDEVLRKRGNQHQ